MAHSTCLTCVCQRGRHGMEGARGRHGATVCRAKLPFAPSLVSVFFVLIDHAGCIPSRIYQAMQSGPAGLLNCQARSFLPPDLSASWAARLKKPPLRWLSDCLSVWTFICCFVSSYQSGLASQGASYQATINRLLLPRCSLTPLLEPNARPQPPTLPCFGPKSLALRRF